MAPDLPPFAAVFLSDMLLGMRHILFLAAALAALAVPLCAVAATPVILDTDIGDDIDDALALAVALQSPELDVKGVVTVLNDGPRRADLIYRILELFHRTDIPIGIGAERPLLAKPRTGVVRQTELLPADFHMPAQNRRTGIQLLSDLILHSPQPLTLLAYGPLTNVGIAIRAEPSLLSKLARIVLMNGVFFHPGLEYNTYMDPEAAQIVYSSGIPVATVGLDVTLQCRLSADDLQKIASSQLPSVQFLYQLIKIWQQGNPNQRPILHDPLAVLTTIRPELVSNVKGNVTVETKGEPGISYGLSVFHADAAGSVSVAQEVSSAAAIQLFLERVLAAPRSH